jgi:hypothetical protein
MVLLANMIAARVRAAADEKPNLRIVEAPPRPSQLLDDVTRDLYRRRIRFLARSYALHWLVDQALLKIGLLEDLSDEPLMALHTDMERARECIFEDVSFEDAGLVRSAG